ncbi:hypothetical protein [Streptomyces griseorubiginosus]|uniref:hypothetical protein n=1 Tax=Streptomyces griseorubiginosus TaxID=67304 RepID=UPI002E813554|nr:hypothetical protein [Streptomyces griseorubiginosus]WUB46899.1 hypothetical protein OHN19_27635 [Streptomyces griseorubiginosus]WUB55421.1 hypothetical protein OG942_27640 [Streptomyces griseorubiginosus]
MRITKVISGALLAARALHGDGTAVARYAVQQAWPRSRGVLDVYAALDHPGPWLAEKIATTDRRGRTPTAPSPEAAQPPYDPEAARREHLRARRAEREEAERERTAIRAELRERREHAQAEAARRRREQAVLRARLREAERAEPGPVPELDPENDVHVCRSSLNGIVRVFGADSPQASNARGRLARAEANARRATGPRP